MFIKKITIQNFRLFLSDKIFEVDDFNIPDQQNEGSGITVFVGENGCGKTSLLDALVSPMLPYKGDGFSVCDFNDPDKKAEIKIFSERDFAFAGTMPSSKYIAKGFSFEAGVRSRDTKAHLSSMVVSDQKFIKADGQIKPKDGSPDLRVSVNNPFIGTRFNENDILFLDKNRTFQIRSGTYNSTRFDRLMEDFDFQYIKKQSPIENINENFDDIKEGLENQFLNEAIIKFKAISGKDISINFVDNFKPFNRGFFAERKENNQQIPLNMLGSGFEMIFSLLYSFYLSQQSKKQLIVLIDEPELHLHPSLQEDFVKILLEFSKTAQIILTTHSPLLIKQLLYNEKVMVNILTNDDQNIQVLPIQERLLSYISSNEINYLAFELATEEYHNELYEEIKYMKGDQKGIKEFDKSFFVDEKQEPANSPWMTHQNEVSIHTFIRNQIHHQKDNGRPDPSYLNASIEKMRIFLKELI
ncbi:MAG: hypothetical protein US63_C0005G0023 [Candidatus Moranbacteria bacterium GW2011_GWC2_37_8]|nr:MAG: hypothetical protein US63_C0005G0023 [Candidatus Moranbacteria bacterium GW2011_GWC2_37_8]KKQ62624.1 MAG: hypothetical protein US82_C0008G0006 [Parcubacteria group bacterium GW2011_GWC1_38_22]KKQ79466.1 MAG: hypothetical protein UT03_C0053G0011 [Candidatus Moranbacteria bacterium GW2011_GWD2_38_7]